MKKGGRGSESKRDLKILCCLLALKVEDCATYKGCSTSLEARKGKEPESPLDSPERMNPQ